MKDKIKLSNIMDKKDMWVYLKYQLISKIIVGIVLIPAYRLLIESLTHSLGMTNISSGNFTQFLLSFQGFLALLIGGILLIVILGLDINAFIIISGLKYQGRDAHLLREILPMVWNKTKAFFSLGGIFLSIYIAFIFPLIGMGISLSPLKNFKIPNFISSVIFATPKYLALYVACLIVLSILSIIYIFTLHYMILAGKGMKEALKSSRLLIKKHWNHFIPTYLWILLKAFILVTAFVVAAVLIGLFASDYISSVKASDFVLIFSMMLTWEIIGFVTLISLPFTISLLTKLFYTYVKAGGAASSFEFSSQDDAKALQVGNDNARIHGSSTKHPKLGKSIIGGAIIILLIFDIVVSTGGSLLFEEVFLPRHKVMVIAHRGGGDLAPENTAIGVTKAWDNHASFSEIDVQRTEDGKYIINHDSTFDRVCSVPKKSSEMALSQIEKLHVKYPDGMESSEKVSTLQDILNAAKSKIGVFVELKGETADEKMADDVVKIIKNYGMEKDCVLLSLDYSLIEYIENTYPEFDTGYLYYFSTGNVGDLKGDYLIMEEAEGTESKIDEVHRAGKKAIIWTVNTDESINKFLGSEADGIITDHVKRVNELKKERAERSHAEILTDWFFGE